MLNAVLSLKKFTSLKNSTLLTITLNKSGTQYFLRCQWLLSLSRYSPLLWNLQCITQFMRTRSTLSQSMNSQIPFWYSSFKNPFQYYPTIFTQAFWIDSFLPVFQSKICSRSPSLPCMPHSLPILWLFFDTPSIWQTV